jgi:hypothetical protein
VFEGVVEVDVVVKVAGTDNSVGAADVLMAGSVTAIGRGVLVSKA